jgi:hypothetical protein
MYATTLVRMGKICDGIEATYLSILFANRITPSAVSLSKGWMTDWQTECLIGLNHHELEIETNIRSRCEMMKTSVHRALLEQLQSLTHVKFTLLFPYLLSCVELHHHPRTQHSVTPMLLRGHPVNGSLV